MLLSDLFDIDLLREMLEKGYVRSQRHPFLPLVIFNYTEVAAYERVWNPVTETCRGLIVRVRQYEYDGEIVARPFRKFFNYGEPYSPVIPLDAGVHVYDKMDGSLGILYPTAPGQYAIATRGSFTSDQARHATRVWQTKYAHVFQPKSGITMLFEIIYPANRIVCDYGDMDDLVLLGAVEHTYGTSFDPDESEAFGFWPGPVAQAFHYDSLRAALEASPRPGAEGYVVRRWHSEDRLKLKQDDYVALHRIITNCTARRIWEYAAVFASLSVAPEGKTTEFLVRRLMLSPDRITQVLAVGANWLDNFKKGTPEEFWGWVSDRVSDFQHRREERLAALKRALYGALDEAFLPRAVIGSPSREEAATFAAAARNLPDFHLLMTMLRGNEIETAIWRELRPEHELPYRDMGEDVA
jgi:RNA ligase